MRTPVSDPQTVGPYRITGRLGSGGMGWVYLGWSAAGRALAIKVVRPEYAEEPEFRRRFAREVEAARAVSGAYTAAVVDADALADLPWLATVYVPGPSLAEVINDFGPLPESQVRQLGAGLVEALRAIHATRLVHRDLKPANVLLAQDSPKVIDFGISRHADRTKITMDGMLMGTPAFMSPEQIHGRSVGPPSDVFSLGGVLVQAVTGHEPFGTGQSALYRILHEEPRLDEVPRGLLPVVRACLAKDPAARCPLEKVLADLLAPGVMTAWPPPAIAERIRARGEEISGGSRDRSRLAMRSSLVAHVRTLLEAGLTGELVAAAVERGRR